MSELPSYPRDAAEREETAAPTGSTQALAGWGARVGAYLLDSLILVLPVVAVAVVAIVAAGGDEDSGAFAVVGIAYLLGLVLPFVYFTVLHGGDRGQTYGKRALGIRVVDADGAPIGHGRAFGRYAITFLFALFFLPLVLDYLWPLWDPKNQSLHDKVVGSFVVQA